MLRVIYSRGLPMLHPFAAANFYAIISPTIPLSTSSPCPQSSWSYLFSHITIGRVEFRIFLVLYFLTIPFQLISTGSFLEQGTTALTAITAIHAGLVAATFWSLLGNAIVSTQVVEDGTMSSLVVSASLELLPRPSPTGAGVVQAVSLANDL